MITKEQACIAREFHYGRGSTACAVLHRGGPTEISSIVGRENWWAVHLWSGRGPAMLTSADAFLERWHTELDCPLGLPGLEVPVPEPVDVSSLSSVPVSAREQYRATRRAQRLQAEASLRFVQLAKAESKVQAERILAERRAQREEARARRTPRVQPSATKTARTELKKFLEEIKTDRVE